MFRFGVFGLGFLSYAFLSAQTIQVVDLFETKAIEGVHLYTNDKIFTATTNSTGEAILLSNLQANDTIYFQHISYKMEQFTLADLQKMNYVVGLINKDEELVEVVVSVGKIRESLDEVTNKVNIIKSEVVALQNPQNSADMLEATGNVYVQKSQMGGGSPVIRGFEANKVLLVVDGVRMNNAIYRGGHLQSAITIDNAILDRTEVVFGPGSVIYGSDALGGVMHFMTKKPPLATGSNSTAFNGSAMLRYNSANNEKTGHLDFALGGK